MMNLNFSQDESHDEPHNYLPRCPQDHYIGIDVGTGSARACIIDSTGEIKGLASHNIKLWQPASYGGGHYVRYFSGLLGQ